MGPQMPVLLRDRLAMPRLRNPAGNPSIAAFSPAGSRRLQCLFVRFNSLSVFIDLDETRRRREKTKPPTGFLPIQASRIWVCDAHSHLVDRKKPATSDRMKNQPFAFSRKLPALSLPFPERKGSAQRHAHSSDHPVGDAITDFHTVLLL